jgi:hypothetical protein
MFERFHEDARAVVVRGRDEAVAAGQREIGSEYLLLGMLAAVPGSGGAGSDGAGSGGAGPAGGKPVAAGPAAAALAAGIIDQPGNRAVAVLQESGVDIAALRADLLGRMAAAA